MNKLRKETHYFDIYDANFKNIIETPHFNYIAKSCSINTTIYNLFFDLALYIAKKMLIEASFNTQSVSIFRTIRNLLYFVSKTDISRAFLERSCDDIQRYTNDRILSKIYFYFLSLFDFNKNIRLIRYFFENYEEKPGIFFLETKNNYYFFYKDQYLFHIRNVIKKEYNVCREERDICVFLYKNKSRMFNKTDSNILIYLHDIYADFLIYAIRLISNLDSRFYIESDNDKVYLTHHLDFYLFRDYENDKLFLFTHTILDFYNDYLFTKIGKTIRIEVLYDCDLNRMNILFGFSENNDNRYVSHGNQVVSYNLKDDFLLEQKEKFTRLIAQYLLKEKIDVFCTEII
ncbi:MAG: hypothetical protein QXN68_02170 [Thermoplasmata archaeon]